MEGLAAVCHTSGQCEPLVADATVQQMACIQTSQEVPVTDQCFSAHTAVARCAASIPVRIFPAISFCSVLLIFSHSHTNLQAKLELCLHTHSGLTTCLPSHIGRPTHPPHSRISHQLDLMYTEPLKPFMLCFQSFLYKGATAGMHEWLLDKISIICLCWFQSARLHRLGSTGCCAVIHSLCWGKSSRNEPKEPQNYLPG